MIKLQSALPQLEGLICHGTELFISKFLHDSVIKENNQVNG